MIHQQYNTFLLLKETVFFNFLTFLFDKELLHEYNIEVGYGDIAQSVRALASHARGRGFESLCLYHKRNIKKICSAKTPILSGFFAAQTPGFGDAYS